MANNLFSSDASFDFRGKLFGHHVNYLVIPVILIILIILFACLEDSAKTLTGFYVSLGLLVIWTGVCIVQGFRGKTRSVDGEASIMQMEFPQGHKLNYVNPPDAIFDPDNQRAIARGLLIGFDENLTPDGEVIGNASDKNFRFYSEEEKEAFRKKHREEITKKIRIIDDVATHEGLLEEKADDDEGIEPKSERPFTPKE